MRVLWPNVCRGCAFTSNKNNPLFCHQKADGKTHLTEVAKLLSKCLTVEIKLADGYPHTICVNCEQKLKNFQKFRSSVLRIHKQFSSQIKQTLLQNHIRKNKTKTVKTINSKDAIEEPHSIIDVDPLDSLDDPLGVETDATKITLLDIQIIDEDLISDGNITTSTYLENIEAVREKLKADEAQDETTVYSIEKLENKNTANVNNRLLIDNRKSLREAIPTNSGVRCSFCKRRFIQRIFFEMHLCTNDGRTVFKCAKCDEYLNNSNINGHVFPTLQCSAGIGFDESAEGISNQSSNENLAKNVNSSEITNLVDILSEYVKKTEIPTKDLAMEGDEEDDDEEVVDNRKSLPKPHRISHWFMCDICKMRFRLRAFYEMHLCKKIGLPTYKCNVCDKSINNKSEAEKHIKQLPKCSNLPGLMKAIEKLSDDDDRLNNDEVVDSRYLLADIVQHTDRWICDYCERSFQTQTYYEMHLCKKFGPPIFQCTKCETPLSLDEIREHTKELPLVCVRPTLLELPTIRRRRPPRMKYHDCPNCPLRFTNSNAMKLHICNSDGKTRRFQCTLCDQITCTYNAVKDHMARHTETVHKYKCKLCPKSYKLPHDLRSHQRKHTSTRYNCKICDHACTTKRHLESHMLNHKVETPFKCDQCEKRFKIKQQVDRHSYEVHSGIRPFICHICASTFNVNGNLQKHLRTVHRDKKGQKLKKP